VAGTGSEQGSKAKVGRCQGSMCGRRIQLLGSMAGQEEGASDNESSRLVSRLCCGHRTVGDPYIDGVPVLMFGSTMATGSIRFHTLFA